MGNSSRIRLPFIIWLGMIIVQVILVSSVPTTEDEQHVGKKSYAGYKLLRTHPIHKEDLAKSLLILDGMHGVHFWTYPRVNQTADILASPKQLSYVEELFNQLGVNHEVVFHDIDELIQQENPNNDLSDNVSLDGRASRMHWDNYQRYDVISDYGKQLALRDAMVSYQSIGQSSEGREIGLIRIGTGNKPGIFIDGGMHAREWISPATVTYIMNKLITDPTAKSLTDAFDWYFVPIINVDGYEYTHTRDRFWRKTRSNTNGRCKGVDPNRNWGFHWAEAGSSYDPCSDIYHGPRAFSEPETAAVSRAIMALRSKLKMYLTFHAYSQLWLVPWGYSKSQKPSDYQELLRMARIGANALSSKYGTQYRVGTAPDILYAAAGGSDDWAKGSAGIKYSYCLELRDTGRYGFNLPASQIKPTGEETFAGVAAVARNLQRTLKMEAEPASVNKDISIIDAFL